VKGRIKLISSATLADFLLKSQAEKGNPKAAKLVDVFLLKYGAVTATLASMWTRMDWSYVVLCNWEVKFAKIMVN
jgi:hypothetical protein